MQLAAEYRYSRSVLEMTEITGASGKQMDRPAAPQASLGDVRADKTAGAGDENAHAIDLMDRVRGGLFPWKLSRLPGKAQRCASAASAVWRVCELDETPSTSALPVSD